jgi:DNA-binding NarL/FixJ family response regulator
MPQRIALIGHCGPDSSYLRLAVSSAAPGVQVISLDDEQSLQKALASGVDLLLINRVLDYGFQEEEGIALIRRLRLSHPQQKMMLVSNYPEAQTTALAAGATAAFGKRELSSPKVVQLLRDALAPAATNAPTR